MLAVCDPKVHRKSVPFFFLGMAVPRPRLHKSAQLRGSSKDSRYLQQNREVFRHKVSMTLSKKKP